MARNITDAQQVTVGIPIRKFIPKWLVISFIVACVIGVSVGGYYLYDQVTSTANLPKPQIPSGVITPATSNETPIVQPMPVLNVAWEEIKLPPLKFGFDSIEGLIVENGGDTVSVYRCVGPANNGTATLYSLWRTTDGCKTWNEVEQVILRSDQEKQLGFPPREWSQSEDTGNPYLSEKEILESTPDPLTDLGNPYSVSKDPNNPGNIFVISWYLPSDGSVFTRRDSVYRLFLSIEGHWYQVNFPPCFVSFDAYPETPQLTLLKVFPLMPSIRTISSDDGSIKLFMTETAPGVFWKAIVKSPN